MTRNRFFCVIGVAIATLAGCGGGQAETANAAQATKSQAVAAAVAPEDSAAAAAALAAVSNVVKAAITMNAQASVPAIECGVTTEAELEKSKAEVKKLSRDEGVDDATFDQLYAAGERKSRTRWEATSPAERASACEEWKTMTEQAQAYAETLAP